jgi:hypothetical protein
MTVADVVKLAQAGVSDEVILAQMRAKHASFNLTVDQLLQLKAASVSERVIRAMMEAPAPQNAPAKTTPAASVPGSRITTSSHKPKAQPTPPAATTVTASAAVPAKSAASPAAASRATTPAQKPKAHPATPAATTVTASAAVPAKSAASPTVASRATTPAQKPKAQPTPPAAATVMASAAVPAKSAPSPAAASRATTPGQEPKAQPATTAATTVTASAAVPAKSAASPTAASRATTPGQEAKAQPATPAAATVTASAAVPAKSAPSPAAVRWVAHNDPMGFSVNTPLGWEVHADRQVGQINIQGPQGQHAIIWPMFIAQQQLDARAAATVVQQLARRVDAKMAWEAPKLAGNTARVFAHGQISGTALMRWGPAPGGTVIFLFCVSAPSSLYPASVETLAGILKSFQVLPSPKTDSGAPAQSGAAPEQVSWVQWSDPREGAFHASVPQGWTVSGGAFRQSATDVRKSLVLLSPDRQIRIAFGDANIGAYTLMTPIYARLGMREGTYTSLGDGSKLQIRDFLTAQQFLREYVTTSVSRGCGNLQILSLSDRPDLAIAPTREARAQGAPNPRVTAAGVSFSCTWNGREGRGYYAAATILPFPGRGGLWYVEALYGYLASLERQQQAEDISRHVLDSMGINAQWKQREDQIAANAVQQDNARSQEIQARARQQIAEDQQKTSDMIVKGYEARSRVYDEIARRRENAILGTVDVVDPSSGKQYKIDNLSDYHWMNNQGVIVGTKTDTSPGVDWRQMITLP